MTTLDLLPQDVFIEICSHLKISDVYHLMSVSTLINENLPRSKFLDTFITFIEIKVVSGKFSSLTYSDDNGHSFRHSAEYSIDFPNYSTTMINVKSVNVSILRHVERRFVSQVTEKIVLQLLDYIPLNVNLIHLENISYRGNTVLSDILIHYFKKFRKLNRLRVPYSSRDLIPKIQGIYPKVKIYYK